MGSAAADPATVERLLEEVERFGDAAARTTTTELVGALLELYGEGLARVAAVVAEHDDDGRLAAALAADDLVAHLLLLHGLHPEPVEVRVRRALDEVRPYLDSHGGDVELLGVEEGVARLRLRGSCHGCPSSSATLKLAIEEAVHRAAPDVASVEAQDADASEVAPPELLQLEVAPAVHRRHTWLSIDAPPDLGEGSLAVQAVGGEDVLFLRAAGRTLVYRAACPGCGGSLADAQLAGTALTCAGCGHRFDVRRAGRCMDGSRTHLDPVPLLAGADGRLKVAVGAA